MSEATRDLEADVADLLRRVLKLPLCAGDSLSRAELDEWDSLKHMELIFAIEDRYGVQFAESEFPMLVSKDAIVDALRRHRAA